MAEIRLTCIECPQGCQLVVKTDGEYVVSVSGNKCPRGVVYAKQETEHPLRTVTTTVTAQGLSVKRIPVRSSKPIPKKKIFLFMDFVKKVVVDHPIEAGDTVADNVIGLGVSLVATRSVK